MKACQRSNRMIWVYNEYFTKKYCTLLRLILEQVAYFMFRAFSSHSKHLQSYGDATITGKGMQILTFTRQLWTWSSEGSLKSHTYFDYGTSVYNGIIRRHVTLTSVPVRLAVDLPLPVKTT